MQAQVSSCTVCKKTNHSSAKCKFACQKCAPQGVYHSTSYNCPSKTVGRPVGRPGRAGGASKAKAVRAAAQAAHGGKAPSATELAKKLKSLLKQIMLRRCVVAILIQESKYCSMCCIDRKIATCICDLIVVYNALILAEKNDVLEGTATPGYPDLCGLPCLVCDKTNHREKDCRHRNVQSAKNGIYHSKSIDRPSITPQITSATQVGKELAKVLKWLMKDADREFGRNHGKPTHCSTCVIDLDLNTCWCKYRDLINTLEDALRTGALDGN